MAEVYHRCSGCGKMERVPHAETEVERLQGVLHRANEFVRLRHSFLGEKAYQAMEKALTEEAVREANEAAKEVGDGA